MCITRPGRGSVSILLQVRIPFLYCLCFLLIQSWILIILKAPSVLVARPQSHLDGDALLRAQVVLDLPKEQKDLKVLITEENLKRAGFLPSRVGTLCPFLKFKNGAPVGAKRPKERDLSFSDHEGGDSEQDPLEPGIGRAVCLLYFYVCLCYMSFYPYCT